VLSQVAPMPDATLSFGPLPDQCADLYYGHERGNKSAPITSRPLLVLIHGGYWRPEYDRAHLRPLASALAREGWTVASIEYRRIPGDPLATLDDVERALTSVLTAVLASADTARPLLPFGPPFHDGTMIVIGHSAGGQLALWAAATQTSTTGAGHFRRVVALAPVADLGRADQLGLDDGAVADFVGETGFADLDPTALPSGSSPVTILHGTLDDLVPIDLSRRYVAAHPSADLIEIPGAGHFSVIDPSHPAWTALLDVLA
jgi:acetyl esterase/lipase